MKHSIWKRILVLVLAVAMVLPTVLSILPTASAYPSGIVGSTSTGPRTDGKAGWLPDGVYVIKSYSNSSLCWTMSGTDQGATVTLQAVTADYTNQMFVIERVYDSDVTGDGSGSYYRIRPYGVDRYLTKKGDATATSGLMHTWRTSASSTETTLADCFTIHMDGNQNHYQFKSAAAFGSAGTSALWVGAASTVTTTADYGIAAGNTIQYSANYPGNNGARFSLTPVAVLEEGTYTMQSKMDEGAAIMTKGAGKQLVTYTNFGTNAQKFTFTKTGDGYYYIQDNNGYYLATGELHGEESQAHCRVRTYDTTTLGNTHKWMAILNADGSYSFVNYGPAATCTPAVRWQTSRCTTACVPASLT